MQEKFLHDRVKVDGKTNNLAGKVTISRDTSKVSLASSAATSKRCVCFFVRR